MSGNERLAGDATLATVRTNKSLSEPELLRLCLVGGCTLLFDGRALAVKNRKALALFSYLAWNAPRSETRERLAGLLWSESDEDSARASLRQTLKQLRSALEGAGFRGLYSDRLELRLDASLLHVDIRAAMDAVKAGQVSEDLYRTKRMTDSILTGFEDIDPMFRSWLVVQRQVVQDQFVSSLEGLLSDDSDLQDEKLRNVAQALANIDPSNETACRALMAYHAKAGDIAASLRCYNELWRLLDDEFDMEPSTETLNLAAQIKSGSFESALPAVATQTPTVSMQAERRLVISVGAFDTQNVPTELQYLIQGMRADLIARLVRFREWSVCEGEIEEVGGDLPQLSRRPLDVYDVDATAFPEGGRVRLVLTLKDRTQQHFIWSDWFHLDIDSWHQTQSAVVRRLAIAMNVHLSAERLARIAAAPDVKPRLYDRWLLGQELSFRWSPDTEVQAESIFQDIIREAPDFAPAYSSLVQIINSRHLIFPGIFRSRGREQETLALAKTAVMIDPLDSRTHLCLAWSNAIPHDLFPYRGIFISPQGGRTRLHRDPLGSQAILWQVYGRKNVTFYPPYLDEVLRSGCEFVDPLNPDLKQFPRFPKAEPVFNGDLRPGEILFIPDGWFHDVVSITDSISVTWNFVHSLRIAPFIDVIAGESAEQDFDVAQFFLSSRIGTNASRESVFDLLKDLGLMDGQFGTRPSKALG